MCLIKRNICVRTIRGQGYVHYHSSKAHVHTGFVKRNIGIYFSLKEHLHTKIEICLQSSPIANPQKL